MRIRENTYGLPGTTLSPQYMHALWYLLQQHTLTPFPFPFSPTNNISHLWSAFCTQADTVLDATHLPSIIIPISKMRKQSLKEVRMQMSNLCLALQLGLAWVLS